MKAAAPDPAHGKQKMRNASGCGGGPPAGASRLLLASQLVVSISVAFVVAAVCVGGETELDGFRVGVFDQKESRKSKEKH